MLYATSPGSLALRRTMRPATPFRLAVLRWPPFADSVAALKRLRTKFRLVAMTTRTRRAVG